MDTPCCYLSNSVSAQIDKRPCRGSSITNQINRYSHAVHAIRKFLDGMPSVICSTAGKRQGCPRTPPIPKMLSRPLEQNAPSSHGRRSDLTVGVKISIFGSWLHAQNNQRPAAIAESCGLNLASTKITKTSLPEPAGPTTEKEWQRPIANETVRTFVPASCFQLSPYCLDQEDNRQR